MRQSNALRLLLLGVLTACARKNEGKPEKPPIVSVPRASNSATAAIHPSTLPDPSGDAPREPLAVACYTGFKPSAKPRADVARLGLSCGPPGGLVELAHVHGVVDEAGPPVMLRFRADRGDCFRLFAVAAEPAEDVEAEIVGPHGARVALANQNRRWIVADENRPFCAESDGQFEARLTTHSGRGELAAAVYRGAHMVGRRRPR